MAVLARHILLLLLSLSPLFQLSHSSHCGVGLFCPAPDDCSRNPSLCRRGECPANVSLSANCEDEVVTVQFSSESYEVNENGGSVQPTIVLDEALDCCSFSLVIKVEDLTRDCNIQSKGIDLVFVLDASGSISDTTFYDIKEFVKRISKSIEIGLDKNLVGVITFSTTARVQITIPQYPDITSLSSAVDRLLYSRGDTNTARALDLLRTSGQSGGTLHLRNGHTQIAIVITDGESTNEQATLSAANRLHNSNIYEQVYGIGVGMYDLTEINAIASDPSLVFTIDNFKAINELAERIIYKLSKCIVGEYDFEVPSLPPDKGYMKVIIPAGSTSVPFDLTINDDKELEDSEIIRVSILELSVPYGVILGDIETANITIIDDDTTTVKFSKPTFKFYENEGTVKPTLELSEPAPFDITVDVESSNVDFSETCDSFQPGEYQVTFLCGVMRAELPINITDDDVFEGDESFTLAIDDITLDRVTLGQPSTAEVIIENDDQPIIASFEKQVYRVSENAGLIAPKIMLSNPSPCCFILHAELTDDTAHGRSIDFGYATPKIYNYTFYTGSTCASPDADITITDDMILEPDEKFKISIIDLVLPLGVTAGAPATIFIDDNDNGIRFSQSKYVVTERTIKVWLQLILEKPAKRDLTVNVTTSDGSATGGEDYTPGTYSVNFRRFETRKYFTIDITNDNLYEGTETFSATIDPSTPDVTRVDPYTATVEITDDEYKLNFRKQIHYVDEGGRAELVLELTPKLTYHLRVTLQYANIPSTTSNDYYASPTSVTFRAGSNEYPFSVRTVGDSTLEDKEESFRVVAIPPSPPSNFPNAETTVVIVDNDEIKIYFDRPQFSMTKNSPAQPRLLLSKPAPFDFYVHVHEVDITTESGDYTRQNYLELFTKGTQSKTLITEPIDDDVVELDEVYKLEIENATLPDAGLDRVATKYPAVTYITIKNDDESTVTFLNNVLEFSRPIDFAVVVTVYYSDATTEIRILVRGSKTITFAQSSNIATITLTVDCRLKSTDFKLRSSKVKLIIPRC